jgi:predicted O-methyltransferase YrrM
MRTNIAFIRAKLLFYFIFVAQWQIMLYTQKKYVLFLLQAGNKHSVHSPFIYQFITKGLHATLNSSQWQTFLSIKKEISTDHRNIEVIDFGAGSKVFKSNFREVARIAKVAGISNKKAKLLLKIVNYIKPKNVLEIGTSIGLGTSTIHLGNPIATITTLEGCPATSEIAKELFKNNNFKTVHIITGDFKITLPKAVQNSKFDLIYFDGNHTKQATLNYFEKCLSGIENNSIFIFDDIYWNAEMQEAWIEIKKNNKVRVTVDLFYFGIVFFRKEQAKEHFKIRV